MLDLGSGPQHGAGAAAESAAPLPLPETLSPAPRPLLARLRALGYPLVGVLLLAAAVWVLNRELHRVDYQQVRASLRALPPSRIALALALNVLNYLVLTGYDHLGFAYIQRRLPRWRITVAAFLGFAISNNVGSAVVSGTAVRYRFYSRWGLTAAELSRIVVFYSVTFWLGLLALGGWSLAFHPHPGMRQLPGGEAARLIGALLLGSALAYVAAATVRREPIRLWRFEIPMPPLRMVVGQFVLSVVDWALLAAILWVLLPPDFGLHFGTFLGAFLAAQLLGLVSHVPGGIGVFEGTMVVLLREHVPAEVLLSSLVLFRLVYYLLPLVPALAIFVLDEIRQHRHRLVRWGATFGELTGQLAPKVLAIFTFLSGALLLFSGATPYEVGWLPAFARVLPLPVIEASHLLGSLVGAGLLLLSHGVARRLAGAYRLAVTGLLLGIAASLLKGGDYVEAVVLALLLLAFLPGRAEFDRRAGFFAAPFSRTWVAATLGVLAASVWLGLFAFKHVEWSPATWTEFAPGADAPRFLRASAAATLAVLLFGVVRLLRPAPSAVPCPDEAELAEAERIIATQRDTVPFLVFLRDKALLFTAARDGFLMYAVQGRSWVALGDPVGPPHTHAELVRLFLERVDDYGGQPVFHQVSAGQLHHYADYGLTHVTLGEEARVPLRDFSLEGGAHRAFRLVLNRFAREGASFRILAPAEVPAALPRLRRVSDEWIAHKEGAEKGFSLGFFDADYLARFPVAVVEHGGEIVAFANVWPGPGREELSVDLMRFTEPGSRHLDLMEGLLVHLMLWGAEQGYAWFSLGMAPLPGLDATPVSPTWSKLRHFVAQHGADVHQLEGLRAYKEKFHPVWEPRYLAYPGGVALPRVLEDVTDLVAGGYRRALR